MALSLGLTIPIAAQAYVDPGTVGALYQVLYILLFALISFTIMKPYNYLKSIFKKLFSKDEDDSDSESK